MTTFSFYASNISCLPVYRLLFANNRVISESHFLVSLITISSIIFCQNFRVLFLSNLFHCRFILLAINISNCLCITIEAVELPTLAQKYRQHDFLKPRPFPLTTRFFLFLQHEPSAEVCVEPSTTSNKFPFFLFLLIYFVNTLIDYLFKIHDQLYLPGLTLVSKGLCHK